MFTQFFNPFFVARFVFHESRFEKFYKDVRSGAFPEYERYRVFESSRADGMHRTRPPTKEELRENLEHMKRGTSMAVGTVLQN